MGVRKNSFVVNSIISHFPVKWEVFLLNFFKRQSWLIYHNFFQGHPFTIGYSAFVPPFQTLLFIPALAILFQTWYI